MMHLYLVAIKAHISAITVDPTILNESKSIINQNGSMADGGPFSICSSRSTVLYVKEHPAYWRLMTYRRTDMILAVHSELWLTEPVHL